MIERTAKSEGLSEIETKFLQETSREFRMIDKDRRACAFVRHSHASIDIVEVRYPSGETMVRTLNQDVSWYPCAWLDPKVVNCMISPFDSSYFGLRPHFGLGAGVSFRL